MKPTIITSWILQVLVAIILAQSLFFKFSGAMESKLLFRQLGMEPEGRILIGILELIAVLMLLFPNTAVYGALLAWGVLTGAVIGHVTELGFAGENLTLGLMAIAAWICSGVILYLRRRSLPIVRCMFDKVDAPGTSA
ncbi:MAG: DoxX family protein [Opitutales bacterium]